MEELPLIFNAGGEGITDMTVHVPFYVGDPGIIQYMSDLLHNIIPDLGIA
jgi:hypothetical protein